MSESELDVEDLMDELRRSVEEHKEDTGRLIQQLSAKVDVVREENDKLRYQLAESQKSTAEIVRHFESIRQSLESLQKNLDFDNTEQDKKSGQDNRISWLKVLTFWLKVLTFWLKVLAFVVSYMFLQLSSNAVASKWPTDTVNEWRVALAIFLFCLTVLTYLGYISFFRRIQ